MSDKCGQTPSLCWIAPDDFVAGDWSKRCAANTASATRSAPRHTRRSPSGRTTPVITAITEILDAGKADGTFRQDADPGNFLQLTGALWRTALAIAIIP